METRETELGAFLGDLEAFPKHPMSAKWWQNYQQHGILPFPGAWLEQPAWWLEDVLILELLDEHANLPYEIASARRVYTQIVAQQTKELTRG